MKKILLLIALILFSCSKEDQDCNCMGKFTTFGNQTGHFFVNNLPIDCETKSPTQETLNNLPSNYIFLGCR
jgi:hypothetical protein